MDEWNTRVDHPTRHSAIHRFFRGRKFVRDTVVARNAIYSFELAFVHLGNVKTRSYIYIFCDSPIIIVYSNIRNVLIKFIGCIIFHLVDNMPMDALSESLPFGTATSFQNKVNALWSIV